MPFAVQLTDDAACDLEEIIDYLSRRDAPGRAEHVLERIEQDLPRVVRVPRTRQPPEGMLELGIREYREVFFKPYRIIYRVIGDGVYVLVIADGRRDMRALLQRRLLHV